ncbi:MAG: MlaD family protein [Bacteroidetes bacterium]|nr:MlaD family protein [Bacteroidota bacterium]MDA1335803.1 MlaD family protein [Bacteroidota bacterium]
MGQVSKEFRIGALVIVGLILLVLGVNYLRGFNPFGNSQTYYARYEKIDGLAISNPVLINGFKVGQVTRVYFSETGDGSLIVAFDVEESSLKLTRDAKAKITSSDLFGTKAIDLINGESEELALPGDTLISDLEMGIAEAVRIELMPLKNKTDQLIDGVDDILENLKAVFEADATLGLPTAFESIQRTVESLEQTSLKLDAMVAENRSTLASILRNVDGITTNLKNHNDELSNVMENFSDISDSLAAVNFAQTIERANTALIQVDEITRKINNGEGSLAQLINSDSLHNGLIETNRELEFLINDLYMNPWRYVRVSVFGRKQDKALSEKELEKLREIIDEEIENRSSDDN